MAAAQPPRSRGGLEGPAEERLPGGKNRNDEILKQDHKENLADLAEIRRLAESITSDLEKTDRHVLSVRHLRSLDEIEKLTRRVRTRMRRF